MKKRVKRRVLSMVDRSRKDAALVLTNHFGGGALPLPSTLGWGQHKIDKSRITLPQIGSQR